MASTSAKRKHTPAVDSQTTAVDPVARRKSTEKTISEALQQVIAEEDARRQAEKADQASKPSRLKSDDTVTLPHPVLEIRDLKKSWGSLRVFQALNIQVYAGDIVGVVGENGAGKSTLFKCIAGLTPHDSGSISIGGLSHDEGRKRLNALWVQNGFDGNTTVKDNFKFYSTVYGIPYEEAPIIAKLAEFGISKLYNRFFKHLSTGQRRKCAIVRSLIKPDLRLLLQDEPTGGLDFTSQATYHSFIRRHSAMNPQVGYMIITHMFTDLQNLCNKLLILQQGAVVDYLPMAELKAKYLKGYVITILVQAEKTVTQAVAKVLQAVPACQYVIKPTPDTKLTPVYIRFLAPLNQFNNVDRFLTKYIVQKTVRALDLATFLDLVMAGVIFRTPYGEL